MENLTKSTLLTAFDVRLDLRPVALPNGHQVCIRELTGAGADAFALASQKTPDLARATLVAVCACDEQGDLLFAPGDAATVAGLPNRVLNPIVEAIIAHNHLGPEAAQEAVPFSATGPLSGSGSASPATSAPPSPT